jgi:hypothetical protein
MMEYNTSRPALILKEYGRNVQKLIAYLDTIEDKEKRTVYAATLVDLMKQVTPSHKDNQSDNSQKLWDDLYIMSDYTASLEGPFPMPERAVQEKKPEKVGYQNNRIKLKHYGRNIELLIEQAIEKEEGQAREDAIVYIGRLMKSFYSTWNKDFIEDKLLIKQIESMSGGKLIIDEEKVTSGGLFEPLFKDAKRQQTNNGGHAKSRQGGGHRSGGKNNNNRNNQNRRRNN